MSIAYLDPGNVESDLQCGAVAGFKVSPGPPQPPGQEAAGDFITSPALTAAQPYGKPASPAQRVGREWGGPPLALGEGT